MPWFRGECFVLASVLAVPLAACQGPPEIAMIDLAGDDFALGFFLALDPAGGVSRVSDPLSMEQGELVLGSPSFRLDDQEDRAVLVTFAEETFVDRLPGYAPDRKSQARLELAEVVSPSQSIFDDPQRLEPPREHRAFEILASEASLVPLDPSSSSQILGKLILELPSNPEFCDRFGELRIRPFGATAQILPPIEPLLVDMDLKVVIPLGRNHALVGTRKMLAVVERGDEMLVPSEVATPTTAMRVLTKEQVLPPLLHFGPGITLEDEISPEGRRRGWVVGVSLDDDRHGEIIEIEVGIDGIRVIGTASVSEASKPLPPLLGIMRDDHGALVASGVYGGIVSRAAGAEEFGTVPSPTARGILINKVIATHDPASPHLVVADAKMVITGDAVAGRWDAPVEVGAHVRVGVPGVGDVRAAAVSADGERWVGGQGSILARWTPQGQAWTDVELKIPPSLRNCSVERYVEQGAVVFGMDIHEELVYLALGRCTAMLVYDRDRECVAPIRIEGRPIESVPALATVSSVLWRFLDSTQTVVGRGLLIGGRNGTLYELDLP